MSPRFFSESTSGLPGPGQEYIVPKKGGDREVVDQDDARIHKGILIREQTDKFPFNFFRLGTEVRQNKVLLKLGNIVHCWDCQISRIEKFANKRTYIPGGKDIAAK